MIIEETKCVQVMNKISRLVPRSKLETWRNCLSSTSLGMTNDSTSLGMTNDSTSLGMTNDSTSLEMTRGVPKENV